MIRKGIHINFKIIVVVVVFGLFFSSCNENSMNGMIIFTQVSKDLNSKDFITGKSWRYINESRIVVLDPNSPEKRIKVLTEDYYSACSPSISDNGNFMLFAGQKNQNDPWQIWEMNLKNLKVRQVISTKENCIDPVYLPGKRLVFSKFSSNNLINKVHALFTCNIDGSDLKQITYNPSTNFASTILQDGRILTISKQIYPDQRNNLLMVLRPDGTKEEMFYQGLNGNNILSRTYETKNGKIVFIESDKNKEKTNLISIDYNNPKNSRLDLSSDIIGDFQTVGPLRDDKLLTSYRPSNELNFALYEFDLDNQILGNLIYRDNNFNSLEAVLVEKKKRPKNIPSAVDLSAKTGLMLCQNINFSDDLNANNLSSKSKAIKMEVMGIDSTLGIVDAEEDGSVYIKIVADTPFRLRTLDKEGKVVSGPSSWMYLRPNERRGCVGCHAGNDRVPENKQALSVLKSPVEIPRHLNKVTEAR